jgi:hypothetical protein
MVLCDDPLPTEQNGANAHALEVEQLSALDGLADRRRVVLVLLLRIRLANDAGLRGAAARGRRATLGRGLGAEERVVVGSARGPNRRCRLGAPRMRMRHRCVLSYHRASTHKVRRLLLHRDSRLLALRGAAAVISHTLPNGTRGAERTSVAGRGFLVTRAGVSP